MYGKKITIKRKRNIILLKGYLGNSGFKCETGEIRRQRRKCSRACSEELHEERAPQISALFSFIIFTFLSLHAFAHLGWTHITENPNWALSPIFKQSCYLLLQTPSSFKLITLYNPQSIPQRVCNIYLLNFYRLGELTPTSIQKKKKTNICITSIQTPRSPQMIVYENILLNLNSQPQPITFVTRMIYIFRLCTKSFFTFII